MADSQSFMMGGRKKYVILFIILVVSLAAYIWTNILRKPTNTKTKIITPVDKYKLGYKDFPNITFYVRMTASSDLLHQFYCILLRTTVLFWPPTFGKMVIVLDDESDADHIFGDKFRDQMKNYLPEWTVRINYESQPTSGILRFPNFQRSIAYHLQLWNTFFLDRYTRDNIIALMDVDAQLRVPMTKEFLLGHNYTNKEKLWVIGLSPTLPDSKTMMQAWADSTEKALGVKVVACFMTTFPQLIFRETIVNLREFLIQRFKEKDFGKVIRKFWGPGIKICPINIIMHYAWYFERDRYNWHLNMNDVAEINKGLPEKDRIRRQDTIPTLVGVEHMGRTKKFDPQLLTYSYCNTMSAVGSPVVGCQKVKPQQPENNCLMLNLMPRDQARWPDSMSSWCKEGKGDPCCVQALKRHYQDALRIPSNMYQFNISKVLTVEAMAAGAEVTCTKWEAP